MTIEALEAVYHDLADESYQTLFAKSKVYCRGADSLHNFKRAAEVGRCTPAKALWGMYLKHFVSLQDIVEDTERGTLPDPDTLLEKVKDSINYHYLLYGVLVEAIEHQRSVQRDQETDTGTITEDRNHLDELPDD
jgi:hypothetical protein